MVPSASASATSAASVFHAFFQRLYFHGKTIYTVFIKVGRVINLVGRTLRRGQRRICFFGLHDGITLVATLSRRSRLARRNMLLGGSATSRLHAIDGSVNKSVSKDIVFIETEQHWSQFVLRK